MCKGDPTVSGRQHIKVQTNSGRFVRNAACSLRRADPAEHLTGWCLVESSFLLLFPEGEISSSSDARNGVAFALVELENLL